MSFRPLVWLNGQMLPAEEARLPLDDAALTAAVIVSDRLRTFHHQPFLLPEHLERLRASARGAMIPLPWALAELRDLTHEVIAANARNLFPENDLSVSLWVSAGRGGVPSLGIAAVPIPARHYWPGYDPGLRVAVPPTRAMDPLCLSPAIKTRNRLHWHIADRQAAERDPGAVALLLDREGFVTETSAANLFAVIDGELLTPARARTLSGISQQFVIDFAGELGLPIAEADLVLDDVITANELFASSSISCLQPVTHVNGKAIADGRPGPIYKRLIAAWSQRVDLDIVSQMRRMAADS